MAHPTRVASGFRSAARWATLQGLAPTSAAQLFTTPFQPHDSAQPDMAKVLKPGRSAALTLHAPRMLSSASAAASSRRALLCRGASVWRARLVAVT
jgi:hypothetical protein